MVGNAGGGKPGSHGSIESEEEIKSLLMKVKEESEKVDL